MRTLLLLLPLLLSSTHSTSDAQCTTMQWQIFSDANCTTVDAQGSAKWNVWFTPAHVTEMADGCFSAEGNIFGHIHLACTQQNVTMVRGPGSCKPYRGHPPQTFTFEQGKCSHAFEAGAIVTYTMYTAPKQEQEHSAPRVGSATRRDDFPPTATAAAAAAGTETSPKDSQQTRSATNALEGATRQGKAIRGRSVQHCAPSADFRTLTVRSALINATHA